MSYNIPWPCPHEDNFACPTLCVAFVDVSNGLSAVISYISTKHFTISLNGVFLTKCQNQLLLEDVLKSKPVPSPMTWRSRPVRVGDSSAWRGGGGRIQSTKCDLQQQCFDSNYKLRLSLSDSIAPCNGCFNSGGGGRGASTAFNEIQPFPAPAESE